MSYPSEMIGRGQPLKGPINIVGVELVRVERSA